MAITDNIGGRVLDAGGVTGGGWCAYAAAGSLPVSLAACAEIK